MDEQLKTFDYKTTSFTKSDLLPKLQKLGRQGWRYVRELPFEETGELLVLLEKEIIPVKKKAPHVEPPTCECGKKMMLRKGKHGKFFGCTGFPDCRKTREVDGSASRFDPAHQDGDEEDVPF